VAEEALTEVTLVVDGQPVPLTDFVARFVSGTVDGMMSALKGVPDRPGTIELVVRRHERLAP
jgi:hypothetical protein